MTLLKQCLYLEQALSLGESVALHGPEVDVRLSTGDDQVGIHGMKHSSQYRVVGALETQTGGICFVHASNPNC